MLSRDIKVSTSCSHIIKLPVQTSFLQHQVIGADLVLAASSCPDNIKVLAQTKASATDISRGSSVQTKYSIAKQKMQHQVVPGHQGVNKLFLHHQVVGR
jgi:hypothetical protein